MMYEYENRKSLIFPLNESIKEQEEHVTQRNAERSDRLLFVI